MSLESEFETEIRQSIKETIDIGYYPSRFIEMIESDSILHVTKKLVISGTIQTGFTELVKKGRKDLTIEYIMLQEKYNTLFTSDELKAAKWRLQNA